MSEILVKKFQPTLRSPSPTARCGKPLKYTGPWVGELEWHEIADLYYRFGGGPATAIERYMKSRLIGLGKIKVVSE